MAFPILCRRTQSFLRIIGPARCKKNTFSSTNTLRRKWQLACAVCLERYPVVSQEPSELEKRYAEYLAKVEFEKSLLSNHELRHLDDLKLAEQRKQEDFEETEADAIRQTAIEAEDAWEAELQRFTPAGRLTEADKANDIKSTNRQLDEKLILLTKYREDANSWIMPMGPHLEGESMREAAERILKEVCGDNLKATFIGNAPYGVHQYTRSPFQTEEGVGAKVFFFKAQLESGVVEKSDQIHDYQWARKDDLRELLAKPFQKSVEKFLVDF